MGLVFNDGGSGSCCAGSGSGSGSRSSTGGKASFLTNIKKINKTRNKVKLTRANRKFLKSIGLRVLV